MRSVNRMPSGYVRSPSSSSTRPSARRISGVGWPQLIQRSRCASASQDPSTVGQVQLHIERQDRLVGQPRGFLQPSAGATGGAQRADRQRGKRRGRIALAGRVGDDQPQAVRVAGVVKEVAADVIAGQHAPGEVGPADASKPRRQQVLLNLGGGLRVLAPTDGMQRVGVAGGQLQR